MWTLPGLEHLTRPGHYATWLESLIPAFEKHDSLDLHWITMCRDVSCPTTHEVFGQTFHILPRWKKSFSMATAYLLETRRISNLIRDIQPDLLHAWGSEDVYGIAASRIFSPKQLFTLQGCLTDYLNLLGGGFLFRLQTFYEKKTIRCYRYGTAESPAAATSLRKIHPEMSIQLVDYGVNSEFYLSRWNPSPEPIVAFVGAVTKRKGIHDLIELARQPALRYMRFHILGDGGLIEELRHTSPANVIWLGKCSRQQVIDTLSRAWCLFIPTYADTGPTVIKEARVIGLPVITTSAAGASTYISSSQSGFVTESGDLDAMREALFDICSSRDHAIAIGRRKHDEHRKKLSAQATTSAFADIYNSMTS